MARLSTLVGTLALLLLRPALAVPNVTAVRINDDSCQKYPAAFPLTGGDRVDASRYLQLVINQSDDSAVDDLYATEIPEHYDGSGQGEPLGDFNFVKLAFSLLKSRSFARVYFRCFDGVLRLGSDFSNDLPPLYNTSQLPALGVYKDKRNGFIIESNPKLEATNATAAAPWRGYPIEAYAHYDPATGQRLPGVFLGVLNSTTWGFDFDRSGPCGEPYVYNARLQGLPQDPNVTARATNDPEFFGFIQVIEYI